MPGLLAKKEMSSMHKMHIAEPEKPGTAKESLGVQLLQHLQQLAEQKERELSGISGMFGQRLNV